MLSITYVEESDPYMKLNQFTIVCMFIYIQEPESTQRISLVSN